MIANRKSLFFAVAAVAAMVLLQIVAFTSKAELEQPRDLSELFGDNLVRANGDRVKTADIEGKDVVGIYFSAQWCPPCRTFTPVLVDFYQQLRQEDKSLAIILVSLDRSRDDMFRYMREYKMPWLAVPFGQPAIRSLQQRYGIRGVPSLVAIDGRGNVLSTRGREEVSASGTGAYEKWTRGAGPGNN